MPVLISPTGVQAVHPDGEVAVARAAAARGTAMGLSSFASKPVEEVVAANPKTFFQVYWSGGRDRILAAGGAGPGRRRRRADRHPRLVLLARPGLGQPDDPATRSTCGPWCGIAPEAIVRPRWLARYARAGGPPDLSVPNMALPGEDPPAFFGAYGEWMQTPPPTWDDLAWLREQWGGPFMLKGVIRVDDAKRAVDAGVSAISVSNHGGNNLDGTPATIRALPAVADGGRRPGRGRCSTAASGAAATWSRRSRSAPGRS